MPTIERTNGNPLWIIEYNQGDFENNLLFRQFITYMLALHGVEPLSRFRVTRDNTNPSLWVYRFDTVDGRFWIQNFILDNDHFNFTIRTSTIGFHSNVFPFHTNLRAAIEKVILIHDINRINVTWSI